MKKKYLIVTLFLIGLIIGLINVYAYDSNYATQKQTIPLQAYGVDLIETFTSPTNWKPGEDIVAEVKMANTGTFSTVVRVSLEESWKDSSNNALALAQGNVKAALINFVNTDKWIKNGNYYYYYKALTPQEQTAFFIDKVSLNPLLTSTVTCTPTTLDGVTKSNCVSTNPYANASYKLIINMESVQAEGMLEEWGVTLSSLNS